MYGNAAAKRARGKKANKSEQYSPTQTPTRTPRKATAFFRVSKPQRRIGVGKDHTTASANRAVSRGTGGWGTVRVSAQKGYLNAQEKK